MTDTQLSTEGLIAAVCAVNEWQTYGVHRQVAERIVAGKPLKDSHQQRLEAAISAYLTHEQASAIFNDDKLDALIRRAVGLLQRQRDLLHEHWKPIMQNEADKQEECVDLTNNSIGLLLDAFDLLKPQKQQS
ncbi:hypothetical protein GCM10007094_41330 [Pseudovibrio japonicus]|uniref:Uncharacterized protein n=1 Tax=Pseudovibrio japonicus TaxID=366534 RepID=A0ABQ3ES13_9HYPH|nr:hypothetical protein [Pseudovibrio japonicus]GHB47766.1 hypothetical protein GCM10007094_41330 [Pseudovibrio japonicus]